MAEKIAVLADIHGNYSALQAVLKEIDQDPDIVRIYCVGDMVGIGYETDEVLEALCSRDDVTMILGNHEEEMLALLNGEEGESQGGERVHHEWLLDRMDKKFIPELKALPKELTVRHGGKNLLLTHYHLDPAKKYLPIDADPTWEKFEILYKDSAVDLVCFGHHHPVHYFSTNSRTYLNPGSLGCSNWPYARYAIVSFNGTIEVELKEAAYDNKEFLAGYEKLKVPERDFILSIFHGNQHLE